MKRFISLIFTVILLTSCGKKDQLPEYTFVLPLYLNWMIDGVEYEYKVGENALYSRSFVLTSPDGKRAFVYELHIDETQFIRVTFFGAGSSEKPEKELKNLLNSSGGISFKTTSADQPGSVLVEMFVMDKVEKSTELAINVEKKMQILAVRDISISEKKYIETEIQFSCSMMSFRDSTITEVANAVGMIAFRYQ